MNFKPIMAAKTILLWFWFVTLLISYLHNSLAQMPTNITRGSTITAGTNSSYWPSPSGDFAFGFYPLPDGRYLIGVWFDKIPEKTLVWSPLRNNPAPSGSSVRVTAQGLLAATYFDGQSFSLFQGSGVSGASSGTMQDDGNFVLKDSRSNVLWESFKTPTNTILPGQVLEAQKLYSNANGTVDYSQGRFMLEMQTDGNLVLSAYHFSDPGYYWTTPERTDNVSLVFNQNGSMYLLNRTTPMKILTNMSEPVEDFYHRAMIDDYGNFGQYIYRKRNGTHWTRIWKAVPDPCKVNAICGVYGYCTSPDNETVTCQCLPGTSPLDLRNPSKGCYRDFVPDEFCAQKPSPVHFEVKTINDTDIYNEKVADLGSFFPADLKNCSRAVMEDCYCTAATFVNGTCNKKRAPLLNTRMIRSSTDRSSSTVGITTLIKVGIKPNEQDRRNDNKKKKIAKIVLRVGLSITVTLALFFAVLAIYSRCVVQQYRRKTSSLNIAEINLREFTFKELHEATNGFCNILGKGPLATVYHGILNLENGKTEIAVKQLEKVIEQGEREFVNELKVIGRTHHKNLVRLLGFCKRDGNQILVYEFMENGSLFSLLFKEEVRPSWDLRVEIALGIARGLLYLHEECESQIIHCDIKPQNVLLDNKYTAKIADFGLEKLLIIDQIRTDANMRETLGYIAPEWLKNDPVSTKVDIFSFGVLLLEIICCRRHTESNRVDEETGKEELLLVEWVLSCTREGKLQNVVRGEIEVVNDFNRFERIAMVSLWCIHPNPLLRPSIKKVTEMLEGTSEVGVPPLVKEQL